MRHASLCLLALCLTASGAGAQDRSRATERSVTAVPRTSQTSPASAPRAPGTRSPSAARPTGSQAAAPADEGRRTGASGAGARTQPGSPTGGSRPNRPGGAQAALLASFGDWTAYATPAGRGRVCYALSQPTERSPKALNRDDAYLFVSVRPADNVRNEVAVMLGFPVLESVAAETASAEASGRAGAAGRAASASQPLPEQQLVVGSARFAIAGKDQNAWLADAAQESSLVAAMARAQRLVVRTVSKRGSATTDEYSLNGFGDALKKAREECR